MKPFWKQAAALLAVAFAVILLSPRVARGADLDVRAAVQYEVLHAQGYWSPSLRIGKNGGYGLRIGHLRAPGWAREVPDELIAQKPALKIDSLNYIGIEREWCDVRWCATLGAAKLTELTKINGTYYNFTLGLRYVIDKHWSIELTHFSHGSMLGIEKDKSNAGWNLLGVAYTWK